MKVNTKLTIKVDATSTHYEGYGDESYLCVQPIGELELNLATATGDKNGLMSSEDKRKLDSLTSTNTDYIDEIINKEIAILDSKIDFNYSVISSDINDIKQQLVNIEGNLIVEDVSDVIYEDVTDIIKQEENIE